MAIHVELSHADAAKLAWFLQRNTQVCDAVSFIVEDAELAVMRTSHGLLVGLADGHFEDAWPSLSGLTPLPDDGPVRDPWDGHDHAPCCPHDAMDRGNCSDCLNTGHAHGKIGT